MRKHGVLHGGLPYSDLDSTGVRPRETRIYLELTYTPCYSNEYAISPWRRRSRDEI
jgi:hypothetical protein